MEIDARQLPAGSLLEADLCIVGGGVAGATLAREFIGRGLEVLVLESGGHTPDPATRALTAGDNVGFPYYPLDEARERCLGGSSFLWHVPIDEGRVGARIRPLDAMDFEERPWVRNSGWPFGRPELESCYERASDFLRVGPATFDPEVWSDPASRPCLPLPAAELETIIYKVCDRDVFIEEYARELIRAPDVTCCMHATVLEIETTEDGGQVTRVQAGTLEGNRFSVTAKNFVLAAGGLDVPRLLLLSNRRHRDGIGNAHGNVGRFFMEHIHLWSGILVPESADAFEYASLYSRVESVRGVPVLGKLALPAGVIRKRRLLNQNIQLIPMMLPDPFKYPRMPGEVAEALHAVIHSKKRGGLGKHLSTLAEHWTELAAVVAKRLKKKLVGLPERPVFVLANMAEQTPNAASRVSLGDSLDAFGQRTIRLDWRMSAQDIRSICATHEYLDEVVRRAGFGRVHRSLESDAPPRQIAGRHQHSSAHGGYHHMGTTRMHPNPAHGVVDADCRVHGVANLFVAGPSVFPTGGYANPSLTIVALALRLADHLRARYRNMP
ncbi:MAG: FAD-dependent oxidoreductase [Opitutaceae bacterium]